MDPKKAIIKYYVGFGVLMIFLLAAVVYAMGQASASKTDKKTNEAVQKISTKLINYGYGVSVPNNLKDAGLADLPDTVTYTKLSGTSYKICFDYKTASSGFDAGWTSLFLGGALNSGFQDQSSQDHSYIDATVQYNHKKGQNCQTVKANSYDLGGSSYYGNLNGSGSIQSSTPPSCSDTGSAVYVGYLTVKSINTSLNNITFNPGDAVSAPSSSSASAVTTKLYDKGTLFCDADGQTTSVSSVKAGNYVTVYQKSSTDTTLAVVNIIQ